MMNDFENLLNDFITPVLPEPAGTAPATEPHPLTFRNYAANGVTYRIPAATGKPRYTFHSLNLSYHSNRIRSAASERALVEPERSDRYVLSAELEGLDWADSHRNEQDIVVALYREGRREPVSTVAMGRDTNTQIVWDSDSRPLEPGTYFFLITNAEPLETGEAHFDTIGGCQRFAFRILPHGSRLKHPELVDGWISASKILTLRMEKESVGRGDVFSLYGYDSCGRIKMKAEHLPQANPRHLLSLPLASEEWWPDDSYTFVLLHNDEPFATLSFDWETEMLTDIPVCRVLQPRSFWYGTAKETKQNPGWNKLARISGWSDIRKGVLDMLGQTAETRPRHFAIITEEAVDMLSVCSLGVAIYSCDTVRDCHCGRLTEEAKQGTEYFHIADNQIFCLHHLSVLLTDEGKNLLAEVERKLEEEPNFNLVLCGTAVELNRLFEQSPVLAGHIPEANRRKTLPYTLHEQIDEFRKQVEAAGVRFSPEASRALIDLMTDRKTMLAGWGSKEMARWIGKDILPRFRHRIATSLSWSADRSFFTTLEAEDLQAPTANFRTGDFEASLKELNAMVGLSELKKGLTTVFHRTCFEEKRRLLGLPVPERGGQHMIFTGNPGTGKTTVARLVGRILHAIGVLSKGEVIEIERAKLVGRHIGETEQKVEEVLEQAKGNVLFIDEAYSLCDNNEGDRKDFGCRVLESLLTVLSRKNPDMVVIMAGYEKEMNQMLELNPGMKGRFPYKFNFEDYNAEELFSIASGLLARHEYLLAPQAEHLLKETIRHTVACKDAFFHNARWVEQYVWDGIISAMSDRVMSAPCEPENREQFQLIREEDVEAGYARMKLPADKAIAQRRKIGFAA